MISPTLVNERPSVSYGKCPTNRPTDQALQKVTQNDDVTMMKLLMKPVFMMDFPNFSL